MTCSPSAYGGRGTGAVKCTTKCGLACAVGREGIREIERENRRGASCHDSALRPSKPMRPSSFSKQAISRRIANRASRRALHRRKQSIICIIYRHRGRHLGEETSGRPLRKPRSLKPGKARLRLAGDRMGK